MGARKTYPGSLRLLPVIVAAVMVQAGCAKPFTQINFDARESYRSEEFTGRFKAEGIALLTATGGGDGVEYRKLLGDIVEDVIKKKRTDIKVIPYWKSLSIVNREGLTAEYATMLKEYDSTGVLDKNVLKKLKDAIGVTYFLQPRLVSFGQSQSTRFSLFGLTMFKTHETVVKIYMELWNADTGELLWIGVGDTNMAAEHYKAKPIPFEEVARYAVERIVEKIP